MVRIIIGTLLEVGSGKEIRRHPADFAAKDRTKAGKTVPGNGLYCIKYIIKLFYIIFRLKYNLSAGSVERYFCKKVFFWKNFENFRQKLSK